MRYAFVSDVHANMQAWKVVYADILTNNVDKIISLGDVVGYGPNPSEIIREMRDKVDAFVLGNHDAAVCGKIDDSLFNDDARTLIEWTRKQLKEEDLNFLRSFPLTLLGDGFRCTHGEFAEPANFDYITEASEALPSWKATDSDLLLVGHTHEPALYVLGASGTPRAVEVQDFAIDSGRRYLVNTGSVGQPRGTDMRSSYCIYDTEIRSVYWRRVTFDLDAYRKSLRATGLKLDHSYYLVPEPKGASGATPPKRRIVFTPPKTPDKAAHDVVAVQDLKNVPPRKKKFPIHIITPIAVGVILAGIAIWRKIPHEGDILGATSIPVATSTQNTIPLAATVVEPGKPIAHWNIHLEDKYHQRVGVSVDKLGVPFYYMTASNEKKEIVLASSPIAVAPKQVLLIDAAFQKKPDFAGTVTLSVQLIRPGKDGIQTLRTLIEKAPGAALSSGLSKIQEQLTIPDDGSLIQIKIRGKLKGSLVIRYLKLTSTVATPQPQQQPQAATDTATQATPSGPAVDPWTQKAK